MKNFYLILPVFLLISDLCFAQASGNVAYNDNNRRTSNKSTGVLALSDSTFLVEANILLHIAAESYVAVFGVSQEGKSPQECNTLIDKRIQGFLGELPKFEATDLYVDLTTQNKIYDYKLTGSTAEEILQGFELKKNVIFKFKNIQLLDKILLTAANFQIYDLVKVDYMVGDVNKIYTRLFASASEVINLKKDLYIQLTRAKLLPQAQIYSETFQSFYPKDLYKRYKAYQSGNVETSDDNRNYIKKDIRKSDTFYYETLDFSGFDSVIGPVVTAPVIAFTLKIAVKYEIEKPARTNKK
ncbi:MAG: hypothetical protein H7Y04_00930 [Verrucomicrobia bacterium]|nr:hypothetical protein [Cytophagales bacterium]